MINLNVPNNSRKIILYYFIYCFVFVFAHLGLVSIFSFFHFLLDHDLNTVENWLSLNGWELLVTSKVIAFFTVLYLLKMNNYKEISFKTLFQRMELQPHKKIVGVILFILIIFHLYVRELGGSIEYGVIRSEYLYISFLCSSLFYLIDFAIIYVLEYYYEPVPGSFKVRLMSLLLLFLVSIKVAQPFLDGIYLILFIHFVAMYYFCRKKYFTNGLLYSLFVISPLSAVYGLDIVWSNSYSFIQFENQIPVFGFIGIWALALTYFHYSRID
jgi:hypothetical protein